MNITTSKLENVKEIKTVSAVSTFGTGLLTSIVTAFIELFGTENNMLANKIEKAKDRAIEKLIVQTKVLGEIDGIMGLKYQLSGKTVLAYGTAYKNCVVAENENKSFDDIPEI